MQAEVLLNQLFRMTALQSTFGVNNLAKSTIKNFIIRIKEQNKIETYLPLKEA